MPVILGRQRREGEAEVESPQPSKGTDTGTSEMSQQVEALVTNSDDLIWIPRTHIMGEQTSASCLCAHTHTDTQSNKRNQNYFLKN